MAVSLGLLSPVQVEERLRTFCQELEGEVLVIIPDATRTAPVPLFYRLLNRELKDRVRFLVALGTHPLMSRAQLEALVGESFPEDRVLNHRWDLPETFETVGALSRSQTEELSQGKLALEVSVRVNRLVCQADTVVILGPVFPHEVAGFSGGHKYLFPGVGGADVIHFTHWLGALATSRATIGVRDTAVRRAIELAAAQVPGRRRALCLVTSRAGLHGLFAGEVQQAWRQACELSAQHHIRWCPRPYQRILSLIPTRYEDLWTGAKGMYKVEPVLADGGEVVLYAPHIQEFSLTHGAVLERIGYHVRDYFLAQWERFRDLPWGVLAHSTHLRGDGTFREGLERPRVQVTLASGISRERCQRMNLGYLDPATVDPEEWEQREGVLVVPDAGETLFRLQGG